MSLYDGREALNEIDPRCGDNIDRHIRRVLQQDIFHVTANTDPKGDRSKCPQDQETGDQLRRLMLFEGLSGCA